MSLISIIAIICGVIGIIGSIVPALPGPPVSWLGILLVFFQGSVNSAGNGITKLVLLIFLGVTILITVLDYAVPAWFTKATGGSKYSSCGAVLGLFIGMLLPPVGIILGSLLGAFLAELVFAKKEVAASVKSAFGAFLGFLFGTGIKLAASGVMLYVIITHLG